MRRIPLAAVLVLACAPRVEAQWFGPGDGGRPCDGFCRPFGGWAGPRPWALRRRFFPAGSGGFGPARFGPGGFGGWGRPFWWRREMRIRRFLAWRRWAVLGEDAAEAPRPARIRRWPVGPRFPAPAAVQPAAEPIAVQARLRPAWRARATMARPEAAVAVMPAAALRLPEAAPRRAVASRVLAVAALMRRTAPAKPVGVTRTARPARPGPIVRAVLRPALRVPPERAALRPRTASPLEAAGAARPSQVQPATLRQEPAPTGLAPAPPVGSPSGDVPVAPLD